MYELHQACFDRDARKIEKLSRELQNNINQIIPDGPAHLNHKTPLFLFMQTIARVNDLTSTRVDDTFCTLWVAGARPAKGEAEKMLEIILNNPHLIRLGFLGFAYEHFSEFNFSSMSREDVMRMKKIQEGFKLFSAAPAQEKEPTPELSPVSRAP